MRVKLGVVAVIVGLLLLFAPVATAQENGTIQGTIQNGTPGGGSVAGLTVTLRHFSGMQLVNEQEAKVADDGSYRFEGLPTGNQDAYFVVVRYAGVEYFSPMVQLNQQPNQTVDVTVYEVTEDPRNVRINSRSVVLAGASPELRVLDIMDILLIENSGDRTYVGDRSGVVLRIPLPPGAQEISPQPGFDYGQLRLENTTLITTGPLPPGSHTVVLSYTVPYQGTRATLNLGTAMPTGTLRVLVREGTYQLSSRSLIDTGTVEVSGVSYRVLAVDAPVAGDNHMVQVSGLPRTGLMSNLPLGVVIAVLVGLVGVAIAVVLTVLVLRRRRALAETMTEPERTDERVRLAAELNKLDEARAAGTVGEAEYAARRSELLTQLRQLVLREQGAQGEG